MENILSNRAARTLIFAAIGAAAGYFIGGLVVNGIAGEEYEVVETIEEEIVEVDDITDTKAVAKALRERPQKQKAIIRDYSTVKIREKGDLKTLASRYSERQEDTVDLMESVTDPETLMHVDPLGETAEDVDKIHVISEQEYNDRPEVVKPYTKTVLHYYEEDDVVTDESDEPLSHPERIIGDDALVSFGEGTSNPDLVFVFNPLTGDMYQIVRYHKAYGAPTEKPKRRSARKDRKADEES